jgi:TetR/AcrR family transcriptional repressor of nem operon
MTPEPGPPEPRPSARIRLLDAALTVFRQKGFAGTSVDDLCTAAGVTKGAFFHHFASKDALGQAAGNHWTAVTGAMFAAADYHDLPDPLDRVFAYIDLREALLAGEVHEFTCLAGTLLQETHLTGPAIAAAAHASITGHARTLEADFQQVIDRHGPPDCPSAKSLALHTQTVLQGAFILAKGAGSAEVARDALDHLRRYLALLFNAKREIRS